LTVAAAPGQVPDEDQDAPAWPARGSRLRTAQTTPKRPEAITVRTYSPKPADIQREWHVIDAQDVVLGRLAVQTANLLRGKHKPTFAPHVDTGDFVIIVNADKVALSGNKRVTKMAYRHSGYPGGLSATSFGDLLDKDPRRAIEKAVWGMLPKNRLGRQMLKKLKVYAGPEHPHQAQKAKPFEITQISQ
jgi:large subunit ribosomal protein L13